MFRAAISDKSTIQQAIEKVQKEALVEVETRFKGQRFKVGILTAINNYYLLFFRVSLSLTMTLMLSLSMLTSLEMEMPSSLLGWESRRWSAQTLSWGSLVTLT